LQTGDFTFDFEERPTTLLEQFAQFDLISLDSADEILLLTPLPGKRLLLIASFTQESAQTIKPIGVCGLLDFKAFSRIGTEGSCSRDLFPPTGQFLYTLPIEALD